MTRLITDWIKDMEDTALEWSGKLKGMTGMNYIELAAECSGQSTDEIMEAANRLKVAAIPVTVGLGIIGSFAQSVAAIVSAMGFDAFVTESTDVNGLYEAKLKGADICFMADDDRYIALNLNNGSIGDNNIATAKGYAKLLESMAKGLTGKKVAVLGYGIIGRLMTEELSNMGADVTVFEVDKARAESAGNRGIEAVICSLPELQESAALTSECSKIQLSDFEYIADCTNTGEWLDASGLKEHVLIVAPGIPLSLNRQTAADKKGEYIHDMLEIGTVVMLGMAIPEKPACFR